MISEYMTDAQFRSYCKGFPFWFAGGFVGLMVAFRLLGFSFWTRQSDFEPDRGGCFGCARCFKSCPQELVRLGLITPEAAAASAAPTSVEKKG